MSEVSYQLLIKHLAEQWQLSDAESHCLLALPPAAATELLKIDTTLKQLFAASPLLAELWMTSPNKAWGERTPMQLIESEGMTGLMKIVRFLCLEE